VEPANKYTKIIVFRMEVKLNANKRQRRDRDQTRGKNEIKYLCINLDINGERKTTK
jgi:hypothetical protein